MEDELEMLQTVYPSIVYTRSGASDIYIVLDYLSSSRLRATLSVTILNSTDYPLTSRPTYQVENGLDTDDVSLVLQRISDVCADFEHDFCLLTIFATFTSFIDYDLTPICGVCLETVNTQSANFLSTRECRHAFHRDCFQDWALQWREGREQSVEYEFKKTRRKQRQSIFEAEVKLALNTLTFLHGEQSKLEARKGVLTRKACNTTSSSSKTASGDKSADEVDPQEAQKRLIDVSRQLKESSRNILAAQKHLSQCEDALKAMVQVLKREEEEEANDLMLTVMCPICRTITTGDI